MDRKCSEATPTFFVHRVFDGLLERVRKFVIHVLDYLFRVCLTQLLLLFESDFLTRKKIKIILVIVFKSIFYLEINQNNIFLYFLKFIFNTGVKTIKKYIKNKI